jgi:hypothetical protein
MKITIDILKSTVLKKGYKWFDNAPNIIGIRSTMDVPNVFNDFLFIVWKQKAMPSGVNKTDWLSKNLIKTESEYANLVGKERIMAWTITTDPGTYWLNNPLSKLGTAILKPNQYINSYSLGLHQGKKDHPALVQRGVVTVFRDNDKDNKSDERIKEESGLFGINIHRSNLNGRTMSIGKWSAGCQVFPVKSDHDKLLAICNLYKEELGNKFTYTLLDEKSFY